jgi:hypothetical protein
MGPGNVAGDPLAGLADVHEIHRLPPQPFGELLKVPGVGVGDRDRVAAPLLGVGERHALELPEAHRLKG